MLKRTYASMLFASLQAEANGWTGKCMCVCTALAKDDAQDDAGVRDAANLQAEAYGNMGIALQATGRIDLAVVYYQVRPGLLLPGMTQPRQRDWRSAYGCDGSVLL